MSEDLNERVSLFTLHLVAELSHMEERMQVEASLPYPGVSEGRCFVETSDWRTQGSGIE